MVDKFDNVRQTYVQAFNYIPVRQTRFFNRGEVSNYEVKYLINDVVESIKLPEFMGQLFEHSGFTTISRVRGQIGRHRG